ncbi:MAG: efflux RND transporter periplasmic adaptor subunit, partial [Dehalococcoidia bacterium]|nr:efflux RND transporter periplasmic adaptor subunit [Dehalococcoidia bacterium]
FDGVVTAVSTVKGATVKKGTTAITMADTSRFEVEMLVSEIDVLKVNPGTTATIELSALSGIVFPAKVTTIAPVAIIQQGVVNYKVKAEMTITKATPSATTSAPSTEEAQQAREMVDNAIAKAVKDGRLTQAQADQLKARFSQFIEVMTAEQIDQMITRFAQGGPVAGGQAGTGSGRIGQAAGNLTPAQLDQLRQKAQQGQLGGQSTNGIVPETVQLREGLSVTTNLLIQQKANVLLVPNQAISVKGGKSYVLVSKDDGTREEREVTTGLSDWKNTEVVSGLTTGDKIAIAKTTGTSTSKTTQPTQGIFGGGGGIRIPR